jgi:hypothetical protein
VKNLNIAAILSLAATTTTMVLVSTPAYGANFSFTGSFNNPNDTPSFFFTADGSSTVNFRTYGWGGGTNAAGATISLGGFDPILTLFDATDNFVLQQDDAATSYDFNVNRVLASGSYRAVLSTYPNFSNGTNFANGFGNNGNFNGRTSAYAFDILNVTKAVRGSSATVPEPSGLVGAVIAGSLVIGLKRKLTSGKQAKLKIKG